MKRIKFLAIACFIVITSNISAQKSEQTDYADSTGLPGDHFSLQGALEMFKNATSIEDFEKRLNTKDNYVNNLDLNNDGKTDYIRVIDNVKNGSHAIVMQVPVNKTESQDIAVIEIEKNSEKNVSLQIVGDQDLYGENIFYEPNDEKTIDTKNVKGGPSSSMFSVNVWVNVWYWPCIQYIYAPSYMVWISPWYWDYYPRWWSPWYSYSWHDYYGYCHHYHHNHYYYRSYERRGINSYHAYSNHRRTSNYVVNRHRTAINSYRANVASGNRNHNQNVGNSKRNPNNYSAPAGNNKSNQNYSQPNDRKVNEGNYKKAEQNSRYDNNSNQKSNNTNNRNTYQGNERKEVKQNVKSEKNSNTNRSSNNTYKTETPKKSESKTTNSTKKPSSGNSKRR